MSHIRGESRGQIILLPDCLEDFVSKDNPVRFIDAFVERLNVLQLGFSKSELADVGRRPYHPKDLLKLYIWGYMNRVTSSRRLERETNRNTEVMWLLGRLCPDDKTISEFRRENIKVLKSVFIEFRVLCQNLKLFCENEVAIDGSKFKASNSKWRALSRNKLQKRIEEIEKSIEEYLQATESNDAHESRFGKEDADTLGKKIACLDERLKECRAMLGILDESGESQVSLTDSDCRLMDNGGRSGVCFNTQVVVDAKHNLIVDFEVTNQANDQEQLFPMAMAAKQALGVEKLAVLADKGYCTPEHIEKCEEEGITTYIPPVDRSKSGLAIKNKVPTEEYYIGKFKFNPETDTYTCPQGAELTRIGRKRRTYGTKACRWCAVKDQCTTSKRGRTIRRNDHAEAFERLQQRVIEHPEKIRKRSSIAEPVFGSIKHAMGFLAFSLRGLVKVNGEYSLVALTYNIKRVLSLVPLSKLLVTLKTPCPT